MALDLFKDRHIRTYIRPTKDLSESAQRDGVGDEVVYVEDRKEKVRDRWIRDLREGNVAKVMYLAIVAKPRRQPLVGRRKRKKPDVDVHKDLQKVVSSIQAKGVIIYEWATGRHSDDAAMLTAMLFDAMEALRKGRRGHNARDAGRAGGRPKTEFAADELKIMKAAWFALRLHETGDDAIEQMRAEGVEKANRTACYRIFGPRRPKPKGKR